MQSCSSTGTAGARSNVNPDSTAGVGANGLQGSTYSAAGRRYSGRLIYLSGSSSSDQVVARSNGLVSSYQVNLVDTAYDYVLGSGGGGSDTKDLGVCLLYTSPSPRDSTSSRMPSSA